MSRAQLQAAHEMAVAKRFVAYLSTQIAPGESLLPPTAGNPNLGEPDALTASSIRGSIGIEVTCPYYDVQHSKETWERAEGKPAPSSGSIINADAKMLQALNVRLAEKHRKAYSVPTYLVLDASHAELNTADDAAAIIQELSIPISSPFLGVYLELRRNFVSGTEFFKVK